MRSRLPVDIQGYIFELSNRVDFVKYEVKTICVYQFGTPGIPYSLSTEALLSTDTYLKLIQHVNFAYILCITFSMMRLCRISTL